MTPDLVLGDELPKKTGVGESVHGLRRARHRRPRGALQVEIRGLDVYDPATGELEGAPKVMNHYGDEAMKLLTI